MKEKYKQWLYYATDSIAFEKEMLHYEVKDFHAAWLKFISTNRFTLLLAPRGHGKTTIHSVGYPVWRLCHNPNLRVMIIGLSSTISQRILREIKWHFEINESLKELYGDLTHKEAKWSNDSIMLKRAKGVSFKECTITAAGVDSDVIGGHYDIIICDDIVEERNSMTTSSREKLRQRYDKVIKPMLEPWSEMHFVGTRWHEFDLYGDLLESKSFKHKVYDIVVNEKKKQTLWPERYPWRSSDPEQITWESIQRENGTVASALQYRNDVTQFRNAIFKPDWLKYFNEPPLKTRKYMAVDLAISEKGDYFAIVVIGVDSNADIYVLDTYYGHHSFFPQLKKIKEFSDHHSPLKIGIEANAYQAAVPQELKRRSKDFGLLPIFPIQTVRDKITRARKVSALFESGRVYVKRRQIELIDEVLHFPKSSVADDLLDALMMAIDIANISPAFNWKDITKAVHMGRYDRRVS